MLIGLLLFTISTIKEYKNDFKNSNMQKLYDFINFYPYHSIVSHYFSIFT